MGRAKTDVLQGTLDLMILQALATMGRQHGWGIARRLEPALFTNAGAFAHNAPAAGDLAAADFDTALAATCAFALLAGSFVISFGTHRIRRPDAGATPRVARAWPRLALGAGQVAISFVLLAGAGLFARSMAAALTVGTDGDVRSILSGTIGPSASGYSDEATAAFFETVRSRLDAHPAIDAVSIAKPYTNWLGARISVDGQPHEFPSFIYFQGVDERADADPASRDDRDGRRRHCRGAAHGARHLRAGRVAGRAPAPRARHPRRARRVGAAARRAPSCARR